MNRKVRCVRIRSNLPAYNYVDSIFLSVLITVGSFVRPTLFIYTFIPLAYWLQRGVMTKEIDFFYFNMRCLSLLPGIVLSLFTCIMVDSFYFETLTMKELMQGNITSGSFAVTPLNFFLYNSKTENMKQHGLHPWYVHSFVNLPILYGVLALVALYHIALFLSNIVSGGKISKKPRMYTISSMLMLSLIFPIIIFSCVAHQEMRFLLPTFPCIVLLFSQEVNIHTYFKLKFSKNYLFYLWHLWNAMMVFFFGFLHQGGVTNAMLSVHDYVHDNPANFETPMHVYFSHMYIPPTFMLMRKLEVLTETEEGRKFRAPRSISSHNFAGATTPENINDHMYHRLMYNTIENSNVTYLKRPYYHDLKPCEVLLVLPGNIAANTLAVRPDTLNYTLLEHISWHLTLDHPPDFFNFKLPMTDECSLLCSLGKKVREVWTKSSQFSIQIYKVQLTKNEIL